MALQQPKLKLRRNSSSTVQVKHGSRSPRTALANLDAVLDEALPAVSEARTVTGPLWEARELALVTLARCKKLAVEHCSKQRDLNVLQLSGLSRLFVLFLFLGLLTTTMARLDVCA